MSQEENALQKIRAWLSAHPFIKSCCTEDAFLHSFLRVRNSSIEEACKVLEGYLIFRYTHKEWFDLSAKLIERYRELVKSGFSFIIKDECDEKASLVMVTNVARVDVEKFSVDDIYHCFFLNFTLSLFDDATQVSGLRLVSNLSDVSMKQIGIFPVNHVVSFGKHMANSSPVSFQQYSLLGVPAFAQSIVNVLIMALPEHIRERTKSLRKFDELAEVMNVECLPQEFGGRVEESEMIEKHLRSFDQRLPQLRNLANFELDLEQAEKSMGIELTNNFKHLSID